MAQSLEDTTAAISSLRNTLAVAVPFVLVFLTALMWWLTGRVLRPVESMRAQVDSIAGDDTGVRVEGVLRDDEIGRLAVTMNRMLDRLAESIERQKRFVADAAHELRTPLTRIRAEVEVDLARPEQSDPLRTNRRVLEDTQSLQHLIDDLLYLARSDADRAVPRRIPVDLDDLVLTEIADQRMAMPSVEIDSSGVSAAHLDGDPDQLSWVVRNLLSNASRHARNAVIVTLSEEDQMIEMVVDDDGSGIASEDSELVFERFTRLDDSRSATGGGTGLGLGDRSGHRRVAWWEHPLRRRSNHRDVLRGEAAHPWPKNLI